VAVVTVALLSHVAARFVAVEVRNVPVERVTANLERLLAADPKDASLCVNLARVHAMAFASARDTIPTAPDGLYPWLGFGVPEYRQFTVRGTDDPKASVARRRHLEQAIKRYREALAIAPDHLIAKLGLGWALVQAGERDAAVPVLREVIAAAWPLDRRANAPKTPMHGQPYLTEEAIGYLLPLLDPVRDRAEMATLKGRVDDLAARPRWITPIAVPLGDGVTAGAIAADDASVLFDADGSGIPKRWTWIRANAAWLVFDRHGTGEVRSALQLFGSVTFWLFWPTGYEALRALDDDGDGEIRGAELDGFALWHDRNGNGASERGEVRPVCDWGIVSISSEYERDDAHRDEIAWSPRGVTFGDGTTRPTFDLILRTAGVARRASRGL
jgi:hypothetical protein